MLLPHIYTVAEITARVKRLIEGSRDFQEIWVRGEVSNFKPSSRHLYFSLKDENALLSCVMFESRKNNLKLILSNGMEVMARGSIGVYGARSRYQLYVEEIVSVGRGILYLKFEQLKEELRKEGYFDPEHKVSLPYLPRRVGVVTSPKGAAIRDIIWVLRDRFPNLEIVLAFCRVQGEGAAEEIARAIQDLNDYSKVDVIIVARGGGSLEDLFAFNERVVAEAIYKSEIPIVSAVGHEIDFTISDFVADYRAPTPSAAVQRVVPKKEDLIKLIGNKKEKLAYFVADRLKTYGSDLEGIKNSLPFKYPLRSVQNFQQIVDELTKKLFFSFQRRHKWEAYRLSVLGHTFGKLVPKERIHLVREKLKEEKNRLLSSAVRKLEREREKVSFLENRLKGLSPLSILERGYSICFKHPEQEIIKDSRQLKEGGKIRVKLHRGGVYSTVYKIEEDSGEV
jgi:exodeoxyribonuclease VII large subunit